MKLLLLRKRKWVKRLTLVLLSIVSRMTLNSNFPCRKAEISGGMTLWPRLAPIVHARRWMPKIHCLSFILRVQQENQKVFYTPPAAIWSTPQWPINLSSTIRTAIFTGVPRMLVGLLGIRIFSTVLNSSTQRRLLSVRWLGRASSGQTSIPCPHFNSWVLLGSQ